MGADSRRGAGWRTSITAVMIGAAALTALSPAPGMTEQSVKSFYGFTDGAVTASVAQVPSGIGEAVTEPLRTTAESALVRTVRTVTATGYCSCAVCCGKEDGVTASGARCHWGTIAAPRGWSFGSRYTIGGLSGVFTVEDRGGSISGNRIDIWFPSHTEALSWGRRTVTITAIE